MKINKKAQAPEIWKVIAAVLALIVLAVSIFLVYKYVLGTGEDIGDLGSCKGRGGQCKSDCSGDEMKVFGLGCPDDEYCCIPEEEITS